MRRILVCEDEAAIRDFVAFNLRRSGYEVIEADSGEKAIALFDQTENIGVALLDVMLPGMDGFAVCHALRERDDRMGIIMLTARTQERDKVGGLMTGADDYVTKPFSPSELMARIDALYRRVERERPENAQAYVETLESGDFTLNLRNRQLTHQGNPVELTQVEFQMMEYFITSGGQELSRADILKRVWGESYYGEEKIVDVNIRRLRMKIEKDPSAPQHIQTVWGRGYRWVP